MAPDKTEQLSRAAGDGPNESGRELVYRFAAIVTTVSGRYQGMATLISPSQAITPFHVLQKARMLDKDSEGTLVSMPGAMRRFVVGSTDEKADLAILQMEEDKPLQGLVGRSLEIFSDLPAPRSRWLSVNGPDVRNPIYLEGTFNGPVRVNEREYLKLSIEQPETYSLQGISGAPVFIDGKLVGLAALEIPSERSLYAIPISQLLASSAGRALRDLAVESEGNKEKRQEGEEKVSSAGGSNDAQRTLTSQEIGRLSNETRRLFDRAWQLSKSYGRRHVHTEHLLVAMQELEGNQLHSLLAGAKVDLYQLFEKDLVSPTKPRVGEDEKSEYSDNFPPISGNIRKSIVAAIERATKDDQSMVETPYILYGVLAANKNSRIEQLKRLRITADRVILRPPLTVTPTGSGPEFTSIEANSVLAGYNSDEAAGEDLLNIRAEVNRLASVLAAKEVEPPLSLGLFGEWGSGKSFFMKKLEGRIKSLADDAMKAEEQQSESAYCSRVLQITFNAWSYIDSDLWASLTSEIFENLAAEILRLRNPKSDPDSEKRALALAAASSSQTVLENAEKTKLAAEAELRETETKLAELQQSEVAIEAKLKPKEVLKQALGFAMQDETVRGYVGEVKAALGISQTTAVAGEVQSEILELQGTWSSIFFTLKHDPRLWIWLAVLMVVVGAGWGVHEMLARRGVTEYLTQIGTATITILGLTLRVLKPLIRKSRELANIVANAEKKKREVIEKKQKERVADLENRRDAVRQNLEAATKNAAEAHKKVNQLNKQIENMRKDRQTADFIRARHESTDYTQRLGTISRVRNDLKQLSVLLRDARLEAESDRAIKTRQKTEDERRKKEDEKAAAESNLAEPASGQKEGQSKDEKQGPLFPRIDRIVLYIDDLDRCPEETVVKVLQAVHLLLAFPLFVVVVGVDPRWLLYSLKQSSRAFRNQEVDEGDAGVVNGENQWHSTPMNYLEKIFQIPFTLRPIRRKGFQSMVDRYARSPVRWTSSSRASSTNVGNQVVPDKTMPTVTSQGTAAPKDSGANATVDLRGGQQKDEHAAQTRVAGSAASPTATSNAASAAGPAVGGTPADATTIGASEGKSNPVPTSMGHGAPLLEDAAGAKEEEIDRAPAYLSITDSECAFMKELHAFIPSPRAGKRFINIYRLLRASVRPEELTAFQGNEGGGPFQSAMLLLGILTAHPHQAAEMFQKLIEDKPKGSWVSFWESYKAEILAEHKKQGERQEKAAKSSSTVEADGQGNRLEWEKLFEKIEEKENDKSQSLKVRISNRPIEEFVKWAPRVARYSFQSGRVLHYEHDS